MRSQKKYNRKIINPSRKSSKSKYNEAKSFSNKKGKKAYVCHGCNASQNWQNILKSLPDYILQSIKKSSYYRHGQPVSDATVISDALCDRYIYCPECMTQWKALYADLNKQNGCFSRRVIYRDENLECKKCREKFIYSAAHQKYLIETLELHPNVEPRFCVECGKQEAAKEKIQQKILSLLAQAKEQTDFSIFFELSSQYYLLGNEKKSEYYLRRAKNLAVKTQQWDLFCKKFKNLSHENQVFIALLLKVAFQK